MNRRVLNQVLSRFTTPIDNTLRYQIIGSRRLTIRKRIRIRFTATRTILRAFLGANRNIFQYFTFNTTVTMSRNRNSSLVGYQVHFIRKPNIIPKPTSTEYDTQTANTKRQSNVQAQYRHHGRHPYYHGT